MNRILTKISNRKFLALLLLLAIAVPTLTFALGVGIDNYTDIAEDYNQRWLGTSTTTAPAPLGQATWIPQVITVATQNPDYDVWPQVRRTGDPFYDMCGDRMYVIKLVSTSTSQVVIETGFNGYTVTNTLNAPTEYDVLCHHIVVKTDSKSNYLLEITRR